MAVYDRWRKPKFRHPCRVCRKAGYQHVHAGNRYLPSLHPPASASPMTSLPPGKPVCPKCGTGSCLEDKALDW